MTQQNYDSNIKALESSLTACNFVRNALKKTQFTGTKDSALEIYEAHRYLDEMHKAQEEALKSFKQKAKEQKYEKPGNSAEIPA